jgi:outer membrane protein insertion porin family
MGRSWPKQHCSRCFVFCALFSLLIALGSCRSTKNLKDGQYLLWKNKIELSSDKVMVNRGEIKDNLDHIIVQKTITNYLELAPFKVPMKLWRYNRRYKKLHNRPDSLLPKSVERPTIYDSAANERSIAFMKSYLFNQGYFYARITDTTTYKGRKATVTYRVKAGANYLINKINYKIDDSTIRKIVIQNSEGSPLQKGKEFTYTLLEEERSRLTALINNHGYRRFNLENITFAIDTMEKSIFRVAGSPFENAVNFISQAKGNKKTTLDVDVIIHKTDDTLAYNRFVVGDVVVYPDYLGTRDLSDSTLKVRRMGGMEFRYHEQYVRPRVLMEHIFINPGSLYSKENEDKTAAKLGELGIFQYIRVQPRENRTTRDTVNYSILLNRAPKFDYATTYEISNGTTYTLGNSASISFKNKNFMRGANQFSIGINGGIETFYYDYLPGRVYERFQVTTMYYGINASVDFPKFLAPVPKSVFSRSNLPHTIVSAGENVINRLNYFTLVNSSASFSYNWNETEIKTWSISPAFMNIIRVPSVSPTFQALLDANAYLRNSYKKTFIEGENITFKVDDNIKKHGINYSYMRLAFEEAGAIVGAVNGFGAAVYGFDTIPYAQYTKFDFDARHYFTLRRSVFAFRLYGGVGTPYGNSATLPYIKQYFAGGPYSMRGWRIRTLGPGSYYDSTINTLSQIDRTADIKIELNSEYRFAVAPLFAGAVKMNGALFADAGNIWLSRKTETFPGGELALDKLGQDIALNVGAGARFDIASFLTLRVDLAFPVKKPYVLTNNGWVLKDINFGDPTWRKDNLIPNISIGYPF